MLACVFGVKCFYSYVFGHAFELVTDHKPLLALLVEYTSTSLQASARISRWSVYLSMFRYTLKFQKTTAHGNADVLRRLLLSFEPSTDQTPPELVFGKSPTSWALKDPILSSFFQFMQQGWPNSIDDEHSLLVPNFRRRTELSLLDGCILWSGCGPQEGQDSVLVQLHERHPGTARMKSPARMYVWWPGISNDIEVTVQGCGEC